MEIIKSFTDKLISLPHIEIKQDIKHFFTVFLIQSILFLILTPFAISIPAYLYLHSFNGDFTLLGVGTFLLATVVLFAWLFVSILFFYSVTEPYTWPRWVAVSWLVFLLGTFATWIVFLNALTQG